MAICPGAEAWPTVPKVIAEPNKRPVTRLTPPDLPIDMVINGRVAYFSFIVMVAESEDTHAHAGELEELFARERSGKAVGAVFVGHGVWAEGGGRKTVAERRAVLPDRAAGWRTCAGFSNQLCRCGLKARTTSAATCPAEKGR